MSDDYDRGERILTWLACGVGVVFAIAVIFTMLFWGP